ncbi:MAG: hypothetical protein HYZ58_10725 [Acidobacteria bacterium]|nr:hypothetical protein [Acidobacteriota bacterium]MBI3263605.1 hypothetical protein [Acidobacteriota bacterium]
MRTLMFGLALLAAACSAAPSLINAASVHVTAAVATEALPQDPDDPAIWVNRRDRAKSLVLGTMKMAAPDGALDGTDRLDVTSAALGPAFSDGLLVAMNSQDRNFLLYRRKDIAAVLRRDNPPFQRYSPSRQGP